jgi:hypothetical protein
MFSSSGEVINNQAGRGAFLVMTEDEQPQGRRKITVFAVNIDAADQIGQRSWRYLSGPARTHPQG